MTIVRRRPHVGEGSGVVAAQLVEQGGQRQVLAAAGSVAGKREQVADRLLETVRRIESGGDRLPLLRLGPLQRGLELQTEPGQRGAQLVGRVSGECPFPGEGPLHPAGGLGEAGGDVVDLRHAGGR